MTKKEAHKLVDLLAKDQLMDYFKRLPEPSKVREEAHWHVDQADKYFFRFLACFTE
jgi:hypothetical protein